MEYFILVERVDVNYLSGFSYKVSYALNKILCKWLHKILLFKCRTWTWKKIIWTIFSWKNRNKIIKKNCAITVEPKVHISNWGEVRIEDTIIIIKTGNERLNKFSKDLICI